MIDPEAEAAKGAQALFGLCFWGGFIAAPFMGWESIPLGLLLALVVRVLTMP